MPPSSDSALQLFALVDRQVEAEGLRLLEWAGLFAVCAPCAPSDFTEEKLQDLPHLTRLVQAHDEAVHRLLGSCDVLPFKFGALFLNEERLLASLESRKDQYLDKMRRVSGRVEWGVNVSVEPERYLGFLEEAPELAGLRDELAQAAPGAAFFIRKKLEQERDALLEGALARSVDEIETELNAYAEESVSLAFQVKSFAEPVGKLAFLVEKGAGEAELTGAAERINARLAGSGLALVCNGPWAAYSFV